MSDSIILENPDILTKEKFILEKIIMVKSKRERKGKIEYERKQGKNIKREL
jgi:hypothetical protein